MKIGDINIENNVILAPMAGVTDLPFRTICKKMGASLVYTEFVSSDGIIRENLKTLKMLEFSDFERPIGIQIFGTSGSLDLAKGHRVVARQPEVVSTPYADIPSDESDWFLAQAQEFIDAIREEREPLNDGKQGLTLMRMLDALALSAKEKHAVSIKATRSLDDLFGGL